ncbi:hypothetical protein ACWDSJ_27850 [Nocardia sp. NPDC003482]
MDATSVIVNAADTSSAAFDHEPAMPARRSLTFVVTRRTFSAAPRGLAASAFGLAL